MYMCGCISVYVLYNCKCMHAIIYAFISIMKGLFTIDAIHRKTIVIICPHDNMKHYAQRLARAPRKATFSLYLLWEIFCSLTIRISLLSIFLVVVYCFDYDVILISLSALQFLKFSRFCPDFLIFLFKSCGSSH